MLTQAGLTLPEARNCARVSAYASAGLGLLLLVLAGCDMTGRPLLGGPILGPQGEEEIYAIRCITLHGPERFRRAEQYAAALKRVHGLRPELVQILSDEDETAVFYGKYRRIYESGDTEAYKPDSLKDLETIRGLRLEGSEVWPFILAAMDMLPTWRSSRPEWDLTAAEGYWTLHVGVFYNTETMRSRRSAAEEYCRLLREQGEDAYFHHGPAQSSVTVGRFPFGALAEVRREDARAGRMTSRLQPVDPALIELQKRHPFALENGHKMVDVVRDPQTGEVKERVARPSFVVIMPQAQRRLEEGERPVPAGRPPRGR